MKSFLKAKVREGLKSGLLATMNVDQFHNTLHLYLIAIGVVDSFLALA